VASRLLGRHVFGVPIARPGESGACRRAGHRRRRRSWLCRIQHLDQIRCRGDFSRGLGAMPVGGARAGWADQQDVLRFEIAVNDARIVAACNAAHICSVMRRAWFIASGPSRWMSKPSSIPRCTPSRRTASLPPCAKVGHIDHVGMLDTRSRARFTPETLDQIRACASRPGARP